VEVVVPEEQEMKEVAVEWVATIMTDKERTTQVEVQVAVVQAAKTVARALAQVPSVQTL
jgi:hypothetical protein